jgi:L-lactate dehydrogenase complex protein LldG
VRERRVAIDTHGMKTARLEILSKIENATRSSNPAPSATPGGDCSTRPPEPLPSSDRIRSECKRLRDELINQFESELAGVGGHVHRSSSIDAAGELIGRLAAETDARTAVAWSRGVLERLTLSDLVKKGVSKVIYDGESSAEEFVSAAVQADLGVSGVDFALADTGTLVLLTGEGRPRTASLLPPIHIAVMTEDQIIRGLDDLFGLLRIRSENAPSAITFITGPSRTADIEMTLVVGVHGPQQLHVVVAPEQAW